MLKIVLLFFSLAFLNSAMAGSVIEVQSYSRLNPQAELTVGDIAKFYDVEPKIVSEISKINLGVVPKKGEQRVFSSRILASIIRQHLKENGYAEIPTPKLKIPSRVVVENVGFNMTEFKITSQLKKHWKTICTTCRFSIKTLSLPRLSEAAKGQPWSLSPGKRLPKGSFNIPLIVRLSPEKSERFYVTGQVEVLKKVPVTTRSLPINTRVQKADVTFDYRDVTHAYDTSPKIEDLLGRRLRRGLRAQEVIFHGSLERNKALSRGQPVRVIVGDSGWSVSLKAEAMQDGFIGDTIRVRNPSSKKILSAKVVGIGEVQLQ